MRTRPAQYAAGASGRRLGTAAALPGDPRTAAARRYVMLSLMLLPAVADRTELIEVIRITSWNISPFPRSLPGAEIGLWAGEDADQALALIREAPAGERMRCFTPGYGIRAHGTDLPDWPLFEIAFCFACNGALYLGPDIPEELRGIQLFDPDSPPGRELLRRFRACEEPRPE